MHRARSLLTLLLIAVMSVSQGVRSQAGACAPGSDRSQATVMDLPAQSSTEDPCGAHHSGGSVPGTRHCAISLDCAAGLALAEVSMRQQMPFTAVAPAFPAAVLPPTDSPEPLAPPPRR